MKNTNITQIIGQQGIANFYDNRNDIKALAELNDIPVNSALYSAIFSLLVDTFNFGVIVGKREERSKHNG